MSSAASTFTAPTERIPDMASAVRDAIAPGTVHAANILGAGADRLTFRFIYGEIPVTGTLATENNGCRLTIAAPVGIVPYSAEDHEARMVLRAVVNTIGHASHGAIVIDPHQIITVRADRPIEAPITAVSVISGLVALLVDVRPVFDMVGEYLPDLRTALPAPRG